MEENNQHMIKDKNMSRAMDRQVDTSRTLGHVFVIDKAAFIQIAKEGAKGIFPCQIAPEMLAKISDRHLSLLLDWKLVGLDPLGESYFPGGPMVRCKILVGLQPGGSWEIWVDLTRDRYKSLPCVWTPPWPKKPLPTVRPRLA